MLWILHRFRKTSTHKGNFHNYFQMLRVRKSKNTLNHLSYMFHFRNFSMTHHMVTFRKAVLRSHFDMNIRKNFQFLRKGHYSHRDLDYSDRIHYSWSHPNDPDMSKKVLSQIQYRYHRSHSWDFRKRVLGGPRNALLLYQNRQASSRRFDYNSRIFRSEEYLKIPIEFFFC